MNNISFNDIIRDILLQSGMNESTLTYDRDIWHYVTFILKPKLPKYFKLHISAGLDNAQSVIKKSVKYLISEEISFKTVLDLKTLRDLNVGYFGYTQIGKFITVYPNNEEELIKCVGDLIKILREETGPKPPSDYGITGSECIYYRYGVHSGKDNDKRSPYEPVPSNIADPLFSIRKVRNDINDTLHSRGIYITRIILQRGKGGVFEGIYIDNQKNVEKVLIKEGREYGERDQFGIDGVKRLETEINILQKLNNVNTIKPIDVFYVGGNIYVIYPFLEGSDLIKVNKPLSKADIHVFMQTSIDFLNSLHSLGYVWNDFSPSNVIKLKSDGTYVFIDFEHSTKAGDIPYAVTPKFSINSKLSISQYTDDFESLELIVKWLSNSNDE